MNAFYQHFSFEFRTGIRNRSLLFMTYLFPLAVYLMIVRADERGQPHLWRDAHPGHDRVCHPVRHAAQPAGYAGDGAQGRHFPQLQDQRRAGQFHPGHPGAFGFPAPGGDRGDHHASARRCFSRRRCRSTGAGLRWFSRWRRRCAPG